MHRNLTTMLALSTGLVSLAAADTVLVGTTDGAILTYDTDTGTVSPLALADTPVRALTTIGRRGYYSDANGTITVVDLDTAQTVGGFSTSVDAAAVSTDGTWLYAADTDGEIQKIDPESGAVESSVTTFFGGVTGLGTHWGNLYYGGLNTIAERAPLADAFPDNNFQFFAACGGAINSMSFSGLTVVLGSINGKIYRYDEFNGIYAQDHFIGSDATGLATLVGGRVLVADSAGELLEVELETGAVLRSVDVGQPVASLHAVDVGDACPADLDLTGVLDLGDVQTFIMLAIEGRLGADLDSDNDVDLADVGLFVDSFTAGCE